MDYDRLRELQEKFEENPRRYFAPLANEYRKGGQPKRAIEICRTHLAQMPGHMSGQIVFGQSLFEVGEYEEARQVFERALALDPENLIALRSLGDMSLQAGNTVEARKWYVRLLDADPKDTNVSALVADIDAAAAAAPISPEPPVPGIEPDLGDQQIPYLEPPAAQPSTTASETVPATGEVEPAVMSSSAAVSEPVQEETVPPMPSELATAAAEARAASAAAARQAQAETEPPRPEPEARVEPGAPHEPEREESEPIGLERHYPVPESTSTETVGAASTEQDSMGATGESEPLVSQREDVGNPLDSWTTTESEEPEGEPANAGHAEARGFTGASPEPFVNETMAQLYLQQGYRQLALQVYHRLAEARPNDQALKDRIAEIMAAEAAAEAGAQPVESRREERSVERPAPERVTPRAPSIESPSPARSPSSEESPSFDRSPVDSPPTSTPREPDSIEAPTRDEPRAEPEGVAARQPSVREFFATLGRRRPPRNQSARQREASLESQTAPPAVSLTPAASLDDVFAGAEVSPADSRAASRLAGAFSGGGRSSASQSPPVPTPRANPRLQTQESEEDVAKFRAWLDGLTGE